MQKKLGAIKKTEYDQLVKKVNVIQTTDTSNLAKKTDYNKEVNESEKKLLNVIINVLVLKNLIN